MIPQPTISLSVLFTTVLLVSGQYIEHSIPEICSSGSIDSAAKITLPDNTFKIFISSGRYFWLLNVTGELPNEHNVQHLPYNFKPDAALIKDSTGCSSNGNKTLILIEVSSLITVFLLRFKAFFFFSNWQLEVFENFILMMQNKSPYSEMNWGAQVKSLGISFPPSDQDSHERSLASENAIDLKW